MEIDRLSALPDDLLVHILGRLRYTKEAAKTAALSKRWRFLWTKLPRIYLWNAEDDRSFARIREALASLIKASLEQLCSLYLSLSCDDAFADDLVALLDFAAKSSSLVRDVHLILRKISISPACTVPQALYSYPSLKRLTLNYLKLLPPATATTVDWGLMTEMFLNFVELPQQAIDQILSGCPLLSRLWIHHCSGFKRLDVRGRHLRELKVFEVFGSNDCLELLEISAPNMTSLKIAINVQVTTSRLKDVSSVEQLRIYFPYYSDEDKETEMFRNNKQLFQLLQRVTSLVLDFYFIEVFLNTRREMRGQLPQFRTRHLTIKYLLNTHDITRILAILECSPFLDKLAVRFSSSECPENMDWDPSVDVDLISDLLHLKSVEIRGYVDREIPQELFITLAQILLRRAPVLEEMVIKGSSCEFDDDCTELMVERFQTLLTCPKSSHKAVIHFISL